MPRPKGLIKTRSVMLAISNDSTQLFKYTAFDRVRDLIWQDIEREISGKGKTKYIVPDKIIIDIQNTYRHMFFHNGWFTESFRNEFIEFLKEEFPECSVEYIETKGYEGKVVEAVFIIDWS